MKKGIHVVRISQAHRSVVLSGLCYYLYHRKRHIFTQYIAIRCHIFRLCAVEGKRIVYTYTLSLNTDRIFPSNPMAYRHGDYEHFMLLLILRYPCFDILTSSASADEAVPETERMCIEEAVYLFFSCSVLK